MNLCLRNYHVHDGMYCHELILPCFELRHVGLCLLITLKWKCFIIPFMAIGSIFSKHVWKSHAHVTCQTLHIDIITNMHGYCPTVIVIFEYWCKLSITVIHGREFAKTITYSINATQLRLSKSILYISYKYNVLDLTTQTVLYISFGISLYSLWHWRVRLIHQFILPVHNTTNPAIMRKTTGISRDRNFLRCFWGMGRGGVLWGGLN